MNSRWQAAQTMLENEIGCAALQRLDRHLLPKRSRYEDERNVRGLLLSQRKRGKPVKGRESMVGQNNRRMKLFQLFNKVRFSIDASEREVEAAFLQGVLD